MKKVILSFIFCSFLSLLLSAQSSKDGRIEIQVSSASDEYYLLPVGQNGVLLFGESDKSNNNGNWQWIASVGVDPAPVWRRFLNPDSQQEKFDPDAKYIKKFVPELNDVPIDYISNPGNMTLEQQEKYNCIIGVDYPKRIVDHSKARKITLDIFSEINKMS